MLHPPSGCGIVGEVAADERGDTGRLPDMLCHGLQSLGAIAFAPIRLGNPVAYARLIRQSVRQSAVARRAVADGSDGVSQFVFQCDSPSSGVVENSPYHLQTLFYRCVRWPSCQQSGWMRDGRVFLHPLPSIHGVQVVLFQFS